MFLSEEEAAATLREPGDFYFSAAPSFPAMAGMPPPRWNLKVSFFFSPEQKNFLVQGTVDASRATMAESVAGSTRRVHAMVEDRSDAPVAPSLKLRLERRDAIAKETEALKEIENLSAGAGFSLVLVAFGAQKYLEKLNLHFTMTWFDWVQCTLVFCILILTGLWIHNGRTELGYLQTGVRTGHFRLKSHTTIFFSFILLALFFAILAATTGTVHWFFAVYTAYLVLDIFLWRLRRDEFKEPMADANAYLQRQLTQLLAKPDKDKSLAAERAIDIDLARIQLRMLEVLIKYYFKKHHILRVVALLTIVVALEAVALLMHTMIVGQTNSDTLSKIVSYFSLYVDRGSRQIAVVGVRLSYDGARTLGYAVFAAFFAVSEFVLWSWRTEMRRSIIELDKRRDLLDEAHESLPAAMLP